MTIHDLEKNEVIIEMKSDLKTDKTEHLEKNEVIIEMKSDLKTDKTEHLEEVIIEIPYEDKKFNVKFKFFILLLSIVAVPFSLYNLHISLNEINEADGLIPLYWIYI